MRSSIVRCFVASMWAIFLSAVLFAQDAEQLVDVVATGYGSTVREATKAAFRAAVEQVVGTMVDATTLVENDKLIEDEILSYSAGMIATAKTVGEPKKSADGIYSVKVKAQVKKNRLQEKLRAASAVNITLDGADLFARMTAAKDNLTDAEAMIKAVLAKHKDCVIAEPILGKNGKSSIDIDPKTGEIFVNVRVRVDQVRYTQFVNEVVEKIGSMATRTIKFKPRDYTPGKRFSLGYFGNDRTDRKGGWLIVMKSLKTGSAVALQADKNILNSVFQCLDTGSLAVEATLYDSAGSEISQSQKALCPRRCEEGNMEYLSLFALNITHPKDDSLGFILPFYDADSSLHSGNGWECENGRSVGEFKISLGTFAPEELKSVGPLKIKVGHMKGNQFSE